MSALHDMENPMNDLDTMVRALWRLRDAMDGGHGTELSEVLTFLAKHLEAIYDDLHEHYDALWQADNDGTTPVEPEGTAEEAFRH